MHLPDLKEERENAVALPQTSFLYAEDGTLIALLHAGEDRVIVRWKDILEVMADATVAIEDQRFWDHAGVDLKALLRAAYANVAEGRSYRAAWTISAAAGEEPVRRRSG